jgi:hypothetical protein
MIMWESRFTPGPGGVMTDEVGTVTGDLSLRTEATADGEVVLGVQYVGAQEWYAVTNGRYRLADPAAAERLHQTAVELLGRGGQDAAALNQLASGPREGGSQGQDGRSSR